MLELETPLKLRIRGADPGTLKLLSSELTYKDKQVSFLLNRTRKQLQSLIRDQDFMIQKIGKWAYFRKLDWLKQRIATVEKEEYQCLLKSDDKGYWVYSGLASRVADILNTKRPEVAYQLPEPDLIPWKNIPKNPSREYQEKASRILIDSARYGPASIELATGGGKSRIILEIIKELALKTLIMVPSTSIAKQMYDEFKYHLGEKYVGFFGGGKKTTNKLITIGIDDSLVRVEHGSKEWDTLSKSQVFIVDEAHLIAATTQEKVAAGLACNAPYRFFVTATLLRNDGKDLLLEGLAGPAVYSKTLKSLVDDGFLSKPKFSIIELEPDATCSSGDANEVTRQLLFYSEKVASKVAEIVQHFASIQKPILIRIDEIEQFSKIYKHISNLKVGFAHGPLNKENRDTVPEKFRECEPNEVVAEFNDGKLQVLVGTSCVSTGTDIRVAEVGIYLVGGMSEIEVSQSVGRITRGGPKSLVYNPFTGNQKIEASWIDFKINHPTLARHADERRAIYEYLYGPVRMIDGDASP